MRFHFKNIDRPKQAAKRIVRLLSDVRPLSQIQGAVARTLGYCDWHELERSHSDHRPTPLDQALPVDEFHRRCSVLVMKLAKLLAVDDNEAQYALMGSKLTGERDSPEDHRAVRFLCWADRGNWPSSGSAGTVVRTRTSEFGVRRKLVMLTADFDDSNHGLVQFISDNRGGACVRSEISIPRSPLPPFIPDRLRLAYGMWTEPDGASVLFSRDYAPMWRLREGCLPQQVPPIEWIRIEREEWFWDSSTIWNDRRRLDEEERRLVSYGVRGLPRLVELLPTMIASAGNSPSISASIARQRHEEAIAA